jgi:hypothetical protein
MTLEQAEQIVSTVVSVVVSNDRTLLRRSRFGNSSLCDISNAFALDIAKNRQFLGSDPNARARCRDYASKAAGLVALIPQMAISDVDADKLDGLTPGSTEYKRLRVAAIMRQLDDNDPESQRFLKLEALDSCTAAS